jgi:ABC-type multidrug transport system fused ATPase/permease subunit
MTIIS